MFRQDGWKPLSGYGRNEKMVGQFNNHSYIKNDRSKCKGSKTWLLLIAAAVFALLFTVSSGAAVNRKYVLIGDSYTTDNHDLIDKPWPEQLRDKLGIPEDRFIISRKGGTGFGDGTFRKLLLKVPSDDEVTNVIVIGGIANDLRCERRDVKVQFAAFSRLVHKRFPNAVLMYGAPNWSRTRSRRLLLLETQKFYKSLCENNGWIFLSRTTNALHSKELLSQVFLSDRHHPNQLGHDLILAKIYSELKIVHKSMVTAKKGDIRITESLTENYEYLKEVKIKTRFLNPSLTIKKLYWYSSDKQIADVDQNGKVTIYSPGKCTIYARTVDGSGIRLKCRLVVKEKNPVSYDTIYNHERDRG